MRFRGVGRALVATAALALAMTGSATAADDARGIDSDEGKSLVEVNLAEQGGMRSSCSWTQISTASSSTTTTSRGTPTVA